MDLRESLGERLEVPRLGIPPPEGGARSRQELAFVVALLLHLALFVLLGLAGRSGDGEPDADEAAARRAPPAPVRVVFYPPTTVRPEPPPPRTEEYSDRQARARSEVQPRLVTEERKPAARGRSRERVAEQAPRVTANTPGGARPSGSPDSAPASLEVAPGNGETDRIPPSLRAAAEAAQAMRSGATASRSLGDPGERARPGGFGRGALEAAIQRQGFGNASGGVSDTGPLEFDVKDFAWGPYARKIYEIVDRNWKSVIPLAARTPGVQGRCRVRFRIARSGRVTAIELIDSSDRASLDQAAVASIELSNPLPPLPSDFPGDDVGVTFGYYYNMPIEDGR